jgi:hypothetical protein
MNLEIGTKATQFPEKEDINGIFFAVRYIIGEIFCWCFDHWRNGALELFEREAKRAPF